MHSTDEKINEQYRQLCTAVGHLFITFARLEGALSAMLRMHLAGKMVGEVDMRTLGLSSAIYGSMRFSTARDTIKRIMTTEKTDAKVQEFVLAVFAHIGHIQTLRDNVAHQQTVPAVEDGYWQFTDLITTRDISKPKIYLFHPNVVSRAGTDLVTAGDRLARDQTGKQLFNPEKFDISPIPWLYKPSMLKLLSQNDLRDPLGLALPHPPSAE
jgi:hypothetical protein